MRASDRNRYFATTFLGLSLAGGLLLPAQAQQQVAAGPATGGVLLDPVTVTATKTEHKLDEIPAHVSVIDIEQIDSRSPAKIDDLLRDLPGVDMVGGPRRVGQDINIRGFGGQRVVTTLDGARQNFNAGHKGRFFLDPDLLRQVEVVRGSNSALHGSGAIGGIVAMETKEAADFLDAGQTVGFRTKYGYSSVQRENYYSGGVFGRIQDKVDLVGNISYRDSGTLKQGEGTELPFSSEDLRDLMLKATFRPAEFHKFSISAIGFKEEGLSLLNPDSAPNTTSNVPHFRETRMETYSAGYSYTNPDMPLFNPSLKVYHNSIDIHETRQPPAAFRLDTTTLFTDGYDIYNTSRFDTGALKHAVTFGTEYYADQQKATRNGAPRPGYPTAESSVAGYYLQDEIELFKGFTLTPAGRFDKYEGESTVSRKVEEDKFSPKVAANWQALDWLSLYSSYGYGFRAPSLLETYVSGTNGIPPNGVFIPNPNLRPEKTESIEGGFRTRFNNILADKDAVRFNATYFHTKAEDLIETVFQGINQTNVNVPNAVVRGAELSSQYDAPYYFGSLAYARIRGENDDTKKPLDSIPADKVVGVVGGKLPEYGLRYGWRTEYAFKQTEVSGDSTLGLPPTDAYAVHSVFLTWFPMPDILQGFRVDAGVENIFDTGYRRHMASLYEEGRDYRVSVSYTKGF